MAAAVVMLGHPSIDRSPARTATDVLRIGIDRPFAGTAGADLLTAAVAAGLGGLRCRYEGEGRNQGRDEGS